MDSTFQDILFPSKGLDLSRGFADQIPATTILGTNVRVFEPGTGRARGGSRPGLQQYVPQQLPPGASEVQCLAAVVLPDDSALLSQDPFGGGSGSDGADPVVDDPSNPGPPDTWGFDIVEDPVTHVRTKTPRTPPSRVPNSPARQVRKGGSAIQYPHNSWKKKPKGIKFVQNNGNSAHSVALPNPVVTGNMLVVRVTIEPFGIATVSDSLGNTYTRVGSWVNADDGLGHTCSIGVFYVLTPFAGPCTVTITGGSGAGLDVMEYSGVASIGPVDASNSGSGFIAAVGGTVTFPSPGVSIATSGELAILFIAVVGDPGLSQVRTIIPSGNNDAFATDLATGNNSNSYCADKINPTIGTMTFTTTGTAIVDTGWAAILVSFKAA